MMTSQTFYNRIREDKPILVAFGAPWCTYCRQLEGAYDKIAARYAPGLTVAKVNVDEEPQLAERELIEVLPTLVLYRRGEAIGSIVVPQSGAMIDAFIRETLPQC